MGHLVCGVFKRKHSLHGGARLVLGFLCYQILFQVCALPFILLERKLTELTTVWNGLLGIVLIVGIFLNREVLGKEMISTIQRVKKNRLYVLIGTLVIIAICYYVIVNGRLDDDSNYYIGLVTTTVEMNSMFKNNVYNGFMVPSLYLRRVLVTFEINAAVLAKTFQIEPIILMRVFRTSGNVILSAMCMYAIGEIVYRKRTEEERFRRSIAFMILAMCANFLMERTIYTSGTFMLHRAYEGKAYAGGTLLLFTIYLCMSIVIEKKKQNYLWVILFLWAAVTISTSAVIVNGAALLVGLGSYWAANVIDKKIEGLEEQNARG